MFTCKIEEEVAEKAYRDFIFEIKKADEDLSQESDKKYMALEAETLLEFINQYGISTHSFNQIQDKEYFSKIIENLQKKVSAVSESDRAEANKFVAYYFYIWDLILEREKLEYIKITHVPNDFWHKKNQSIEVFDISEKHLIALEVDNFIFRTDFQKISEQ